MRLPAVTEVERALAAHAWVEHAALPGRTNHLRAGVAVPLEWWTGGLRCLVTLRPTGLRRHGGEVSFPGGRPEPDDADLAGTARRECEEEIGRSPRRVLGRLSSMPVFTSDWRLEPFVVEVGPGDGARVDPGEVEALLTLDVGGLLAEGRVEAVGVPWEDDVINMPIFRPGGFVMFGATALAMTELLGVLAPLAGVAAPRLVRGSLSWRALRERGARAGEEPGP